MKDLHSHIGYGIDDGAHTKEQSKELLHILEEAGVTDVVVTPHYIISSKYNADNKKKKEILKELENLCKKENIKINLYLGNEVYLCDNMVELIKKKQIMTLNNSRYILVEFPLSRKDPNAKSILHNILLSGYIPIVAHPERYEYLEKNIDYFKELKEMGVLFQGNYLSLFGNYGKSPQKNLQKLLKEGIISVLGSDIHHIEELYGNKIYKKIKKCVKKDNLVEDLLYNNFDKIINNENMD